jgi:hypothetical protein
MSGSEFDNAEKQEKINFNQLLMEIFHLMMMTSVK